MTRIVAIRYRVPADLEGDTTSQRVPLVTLQRDTEPGAVVQTQAREPAGHVPSELTEQVPGEIAREIDGEIPGEIPREIEGKIGVEIPGEI
jgi:hypothetical protein